MPPRGHSPSSHSSSSHSSRSSGSSFRSSSSRSSGSSFRAPSAHSSSSHSSRPSSFSSSYSRPASFKEPGKPALGAAAAPPKPRAPVWRPRVNQPTGFINATHLRPTYYYGLRHSYAYYPRDWVDADSGVSYSAGYYDENGQRYDNVTFEENGRYKNVVCHCSYCENDVVLDLTSEDVENKALQCPNCGAPMEIRSELDTVVNGASAEDAEASVTASAPTRRENKRRGYGWILAAIAVMALSMARLARRLNPEPVVYSGGDDVQQISVIQNIGNAASNNQTGSFEPVYLEKQADGSYHVVTDVIRADKILYFDTESDNYYDEASDCWLWKNTAVVPPLWQYWYEGISSDYGEYGWMEHEADGWYIEVSAGNWIPLPDRYNTSDLWYIE